jgi:phospholipid/cholesterol/gamma-HCH transport system permease protein
VTPGDAMSPAARERGIVRLGAWSIDRGRDLTAIIGLLLSAATSLRGVERREVFRQAFELANRSIFFVVLVMSFVGAILVVQACTQAQKVIFDLTMVGPTFLQLLCREFGPTIVALMIAARYGAGVAAELGAMQVTEQVDAIKMAGADPVPYLVLPRVLGGLIGMVAIVTLGTGVAFVAGGYAARWGFGVGWDTYFRLGTIGRGDPLVGVIKALSYGVAVPLVSAWAGLSATGGAAGVGRATTRAVIGSSIAILLLDLVIGAVGYLGLR